MHLSWEQNLSTLLQVYDFLLGTVVQAYVLHIQYIKGNAYYWQDREIVGNIYCTYVNKISWLKEIQYINMLNIKKEEVSFGYLHRVNT